MFDCVDSPYVELFHVSPPDLWPNAVLFLKQAQDAKVQLWTDSLIDLFLWPNILLLHVFSLRPRESPTRYSSSKSKPSNCNYQPQRC
jgi:hypothetical protein